MPNQAACNFSHLCPWERCWWW